MTKEPLPAIKVIMYSQEYILGIVERMGPELDGLALKTRQQIGLPPPGHRWALDLESRLIPNEVAETKEGERFVMSFYWVPRLVAAPVPLLVSA